MTFDEFKAYYAKYKKTPGMLTIPNHTLNEKELLSRYKKYIRTKEEQIQKGTYNDPLWTQTVDFIRKRDYNICRLLSIITIEERRFMQENYSMRLLMTLDPAHVFARSQSSNLYYEPDNLVLLNRASHSNIDSYRHPIYGTPITKEVRKEWWIKIIGKELYETLEKNK